MGLVCLVMHRCKARVLFISSETMSHSGRAASNAGESRGYGHAADDR